MEIVFSGTAVRGTTEWRELCEQGYEALNAACPAYVDSFPYEPVTGSTYQAVHHAADGTLYVARMYDTGE